MDGRPDIPHFSQLIAKNPVIALVGPSGCGKTAIMLKLFEKLPGKVFPMTNLTSRPKREPSDDIFYKFIEPQAIRDMAARGELAQYLEYAGNLYGSVKAWNEATLEKGVGIHAYVEQGVHDMSAAGYTVIPVKVVSDNVVFRNEERASEDAQRGTMELDYAFTLRNSFAPGGLEKAADELAAFVSSLNL